MAELRTWDDGKRCGECCNGDRCDDPTHVDRQNCRACKSTGWALWTTAGRRDYAAYLLGGNTSDKRATILSAADTAASPYPADQVQVLRGALEELLAAEAAEISELRDLFTADRTERLNRAMTRSSKARSAAFAALAATAPEALKENDRG